MCVSGTYIFMHVTYNLSPIFLLTGQAKGTQKVRRRKSIQFIRHISIDSAVLMQKEFD